MFLNDARKSLWEMMRLLEENGFKMRDLYHTDENDSETTLMDSVQGLFDDTFADEIEAESAKENAYWDKCDDAYERSRDEKL